MWQEVGNSYGASSSNVQYYNHQSTASSQAVSLQFYAPGPEVERDIYPGSRASLEGSVGAEGTISSRHRAPPGYGGNIQVPGGWWTAFGTGGFEGEPPLLEGEDLYNSP
jgi:hypothetical protein